VSWVDPDDNGLLSDCEKTVPTDKAINKTSRCERRIIDSGPLESSKQSLIFKLEILPMCPNFKGRSHFDAEFEACRKGSLYLGRVFFPKQDGKTRPVISKESSTVIQSMVPM
jgi:hypothetical protein